MSSVWIFMLRILNTKGVIQSIETSTTNLLSETHLGDPGMARKML